MQRYKITIEYNGTSFVGWQRQAIGPSIQEVIENALFKMSGSEITLHGAGRTDAGVHATGQAAHFDLRKEFPVDEIMGALNHHIKPHLISILSVDVVPEDFHARFSAVSRSYVYKIINRKAPLALELNKAWHIKENLDVDAMQKAAQFMLGKHDFTSFRSTQCQAKSPVRTIEEIRLVRTSELIEMHIKAPSFLHNQVRIVMGNLRKVGNGTFAPEYIKEILEAKDRTKAAETAPPDGLYLVEVKY
jgi:tRNA pseudouridine38-40 synthase